MLDGHTLTRARPHATCEREAMLRLPSGLRLHWIERGAPAGPPVLLVHGFADSARSYTPMMARMPPEWRCIAPSQRGHGDSDRPAGGYGPSDFAADLAAFAEALDLGPALVVGHCVGGLIAQRFALEHPGRVAGLTLIGGLKSFRENPTAKAMQEVAAKLTDPVDPAFVRAFQESTLARPVPPAFLETVTAETLKLPAEAWRAVIAALMSDETQDDLARIAAPTLLIWGDRDDVIPRCDPDWVAGTIPGARLLVQAGAGHSPHWEDPAGVAEAIEAYFGAYMPC